MACVPMGTTLRGRGVLTEEFAAGVVADWELELEPAAFLQAFGGWPEPPFDGALNSSMQCRRRSPPGPSRT